MVKVLMARSISGQCKTMGRKGRYNRRITIAKGIGLNFRYRGEVVSSHSIRKFLKEYGYHLGAHGLCSVCEKEAQRCECKVIVRDASGTIIREF